MNVLQAAVRIVGGRQIEEGAELLVPRARGVGGLQIAADEGLLKLEAQDDVQVVRRLIGFDSNERTTHGVDRKDPVVEADVVEGAWKHLAGARKEMFPEGTTSTDLVFPE